MGVKSSKLSPSWAEHNTAGLDTSITETSASLPKNTNNVTSSLPSVNNVSNGTEKAQSRINAWTRGTLDLSHLNLTRLPTLPKGLKILNCSNNQLSELPDLPDTLTNLSCQNNQLTRLPNLPDGLVYLECQNNQLTELPPLPDNIIFLNFIEGNNIEITDELKKIIRKIIDNDGFVSGYSKKKFNTLDQLRKHKNTIIDFTPSKAYFIGGHGSEGGLTIENRGNNTKIKHLDSFIVPKNCIIVAKAHPGEATLGQAMNTNLRNLCFLHEDILKDPIKYSNEILNAVGSVKIFKEGDVCPNYTYTLSSHFPEFFDKNVTQIIGNLSGLLDLENTNIRTIMTNPAFTTNPHATSGLTIMNNGKEVDAILHFLKNNNYKNAYKLLLDSYTESELPTKEEVSAVVGELPNLLLGTILESENFKKLVKHTQKELVDIKPGVYYNFVCRAAVYKNTKGKINEKATVYKNNNMSMNNIRRISNVHYSFNPTTIRPSNKNLNNTLNQKLAKEAIIESKGRTNLLRKNTNFGKSKEVKEREQLFGNKYVNKNKGSNWTKKNGKWVSANNNSRANTNAIIAAGGKRKTRRVSKKKRISRKRF